MKLWRRLGWFAAIHSIFLGASCGLPPSAEGERDALGGLKPFFVATFDHSPTPAEIQATLLSPSAPTGISTQLVNPTNAATPPSGQKWVTLEVITADEANAGTDEANEFYFEAGWSTQNPTGSYSETFVLDKPGRDDLDRNAVNIFYYLLPVPGYLLINGQGTSDTFSLARIRTTSSDAWKCSAITLIDHNHPLESRSQSLPFNVWLDTPASGSPAVPGSVTASGWLAGTDARQLSY